MLPAFVASGIDLVAPPVTISRSHSGQFLVSIKALRPLRPALANYTTNTGFIFLEPSYLTVSCERIRAAIYKELDFTGKWRGNIYVSLYSPRSTNDTAYIHTTQAQRWKCHVELPQLIDRKRFVMAITQALLLEMTQPESSARSVEIPLWLVEGLARQLLSSSEAQLIVTAPRRVINGVSADALDQSDRWQHPLKNTHAFLTRHSALSFHELSWPDESKMDNLERERFGASAHLMVYELLALKEGRAGMRSMIHRLPAYLNWQFALLDGYRDHFQRPLDLEKWWALHVACFSGLELTQTWSPEEALKKLEEVLRIPVEIRSRTSAVPVRAEASLQDIIEDWGPSEQTQALASKAAQLQALSLRLPPELMMVAEGYRQLISSLLPSPNGRKIKPLSRREVEETRKALDRLDAALALVRGHQIRSRSDAPGASAANPQAAGGKG